MDNVLKIVIGFISISFLFYGFNCIFSQFLKQEFKRFGLSKFRVFTGVLQILASIGLIIGIFYPWLAIISSVGLGVLMLLGFGVRLKIKDGFKESFPSAFFALLNFLIAWQTVVLYF